MKFLAALTVCLAAGAAAAQPSPFAANADWPCFSRLVPTISAGSYWAGKLPSDPDWRNDQSLFDFVNEVTDRDLDDKDGVAKLESYADKIPDDQRADKLGKLFSALADQINDQRSDLIDRIKRLGRRQRAMSKTVAELTNAADKPGADPSAAESRDFAIRAYQAMQRTMRYACDTPTQLEQRLGLYARTLQAKLPKE